MFDIPEIIEVLKLSGATDEVVEKVSSHFHSRLGDILEDMAKQFQESEDSQHFTSEKIKENNNENITREQCFYSTLYKA
jgi:tRNA(Met) C34 N-acetyltransferase TmcA